MYSKSRSSQELQKMQVLRANHLHGKKEDNKEDFHEHQEERGAKNITICAMTFEAKPSRSEEATREELPRVRHPLKENPKITNDFRINMALER